MIQDPFNPWGLKPIHRIMRPRASSRAAVQSGAGSQLVGPQGGGQRGSGIAMGGSSTTTGPASTGQPKSFEEGLTGVYGAYKGGEKLKGAYNNFSFADDISRPAQNAWNGLTGQQGSAALQDANLSQMTGIGRSGPVSNSAQGLVGGNLTGASVGGFAPRAIDPFSKAGSGLHTAPQFLNGTQLPAGSLNAGSGATNVAAGSAEAAAATELGSTIVPKAGTQLNGVTQVGAQAANGWGAAAAGLGMGLSAYDMYENGINAGNAMGFAGAGVLGAVAMTGLSQAWNPVGWALLAGSAAYSIFG